MLLGHVTESHFVFTLVKVSFVKELSKKYDLTSHYSLLSRFEVREFTKHLILAVF